MEDIVKEETITMDGSHNTNVAKCKEYKNSSYLKQHTAEASDEEKRYKSDKCDSSFTYRSTLCQMEDIVKEETIIMDGSHNTNVAKYKEYKNSSYVKQHSAEGSDEEKPYKSDECNSSFNSRSTVSQMEDIVKEEIITMDGSHNTNVAKYKEYKNSSYLKQHSAEGSDEEKPYKSDECNSSFNSRSTVSQMEDIVKVETITMDGSHNTNVGKYKEYKNSSYLKQHSACEGSDEEKPYKSDKCNSSFTSRSTVSQMEDIVKEEIITMDGSHNTNVAKYKEYKNSSYLKQHSAEGSDEEKPYKSNECNSSFTFRSTVSQMEDIVKEEIIIMDGSHNTNVAKYKEYKNSSYMKQHSTEGSDEEKPYKSDECNSSFTYKSTVSQMEDIVKEETITMDGSHNTNVAKYKEYKNSSYLKQQSAEGSDKEKPSNSDESNSHLILRKQVIKSHTDEKAHKCDLCQKSFRYRSALIIHRRSHTGEKPYKCYECQTPFSTKSALTVHMRKHTGEKPHKCDVCQRSFSFSSNCMKHFHTHTGEKPYQCDICPSRFHNNTNLLRHIRTHTGERPYKCDTCLRTFADQSALNVHIRSHTGEKPYKCDICQNTFTIKKSLQRHIRMHTGERPYKCDLCERRFIDLTCLNCHMRTHTGDKRYKCDKCNLGFSYKAALDSHVATCKKNKPPQLVILVKVRKPIHTAENSFKCYTCESSFLNKNDLFMHIRKNH